MQEKECKAGQDEEGLGRVAQGRARRDKAGKVQEEQRKTGKGSAIHGE